MKINHSSFCIDFTNNVNIAIVTEMITLSIGLLVSWPSEFSPFQFHSAISSDLFSHLIMQSIYYALIVIWAVLGGTRTVQIVTAPGSDELYEPPHTEHAKLARYIVHKVGK